MIGIVVLNYNDANRTIDFLNNIEDYRCIDCIVVVDNCSTDNSYEKLEKHENNKVKVVKSEKNLGYGNGNNIGINILKNMGCSKIIVSNPDIIVNEKDLIEILKVAENKEFDIIAPRIIENNKVTLSAWKIPKYYQTVLQTLPIIDRLVDKSLYYKEEDLNQNINEVDTVMGCFFLINNMDSRCSNIFDENTFLYYEENILGYKLKKSNKKVVIINTSKVVHEHGVTINKAFKNKIKRMEILDNSRRIYLRDYLKVKKSGIYLYNIIFKIGINIRKVLYLIKN